jgi:uncharacterized protein (DUF58 family)
VNFARLNHILIPETKAGRDRLRRTRLGRIVFGPLSRTYLALTPEGRGLAVFTAFAGLAGLDVLRTETHWLWTVLFALIVASLAAKRWFSLPHVSIAVAAPRRAAVGTPVEMCVTLRNAASRAHIELCVDRPFLPWDGAWVDAAPALPRLDPGAEATVTTSAKFVARGEHHLDVFAACARVPLGLARGPRVESRGLRFTIVPAIAPVRALELPMSRRHQPGGVARAAVSGEAQELVGVRPYRAGDRVRDLHAKTWARTGVPAVREYQQEYFSRVGIVLDTDATYAREEVLEPAISLAAGCIARLSRGEALIDILLAGDALHELLFGRGLGQLDRALDHLASVLPTRPLDATSAIQRLAPHLERLSSIVLILLAWDPERDALVHGIRERGVGCRVVVVGSRARNAAGLPHDATCIPARHIAAACAGAAELTL